jgi:3-oxoacyl-[acyl-carrier protein] reductase
MDGAFVVVNYSTSKKGADKTVAEIVANGGSAIAVGASIAKEDEIAGLFEEAKRCYGRVDILINNAAVFGAGPIEALTAEESASSIRTCVVFCWSRKQRPRCFLNPAVPS